MLTNHTQSWLAASMGDACMHVGCKGLGHDCCYTQDLAAGYTSGKLLLKLDFTSYILQHHTAEHFAFLDDAANSRSRTTFYFTLARLLFVEDTPAKFKAFVAPLQQVRSGLMGWKA